MISIERQGSLSIKAVFDHSLTKKAVRYIIVSDRFLLKYYEKILRDK
jgi:hypothetical protein